MPRSSEILPSRWRAVGCIGIFFAVFVVLNTAFDRWLPPPKIDDVSAKLAYFARHKEEFDAVFVGSSRVLRQISPTVFDQQATAAGYPVRSFNFGASSMFLPESLYVIEQILSLKPARLRWMFIELDDMKPHTEEHADLARRVVYWHDLPRTRLMCAGAVANGTSVPKTCAVLGHEWSLFGRRSAHLGRGLDWLVSLAGREPTDPIESPGETGPAWDGFVGAQHVLGENLYGKGGAEDARRFESQLAALKNRDRHEGDGQMVSGLMRHTLTQAVSKWRLARITPVFFVTPVNTREDGFLALGSTGVLGPLWAFNDPAVYPALYRREVHSDSGHLNQQGAVIFTQLLAERFAGWRAAVAFATDPNHAVR